MNAVRDDLNPKFVFFSPIRAGKLSTDTITEQVDRAIVSWCSDLIAGAAPFQLAGDATIEILNDDATPGVMRIDLWVETLDATTCTYGFLCSSENGCTPYARGERTCIKLDPRSHRPTPWSDRFRQTNSDLLRDLHAFV